METLLRNIRIAFRQIRLQPGFSVTVILTLALAIGATTTIFSYVNALLIRPFPFRDPDQLVEISSLRGGQEGKLSMREILDIKERVTSIQAIAARTSSEGGYNFSGQGKPEEWKTVLTTGSLFEVLGVPLAIGNAWPDHSNRERDFRVILNYRVWQSKFGAAKNVVGRKITLDHAPGYNIDGVAGKNFDYPSGIQIYRSLGGFALYNRRDSRNVIAVARIRRPLRIEHLQTELDGISTRLSHEFPATNLGLSFHARSMRTVYSGDVKPYVLLVLGAVVLVLCMACGNVSNLMLSRGLGRENEIAVRLALGANRRVIATQLLAENIVLAWFASILGVFLCFWWMRILRLAIGPELPDWIIVNLDGRVLWVALSSSMAAGVTSGVAPALQLVRQSLARSLREAGRGSSIGRSAARIRDVLTVAEIALAVVLLSGAALLVQSFLALQAQRKGFETRSVSTFRVALGWKRYLTDESIAHYYEQLQTRLSATAGVERVGFTSSPPLARLESNPNTVQAEGQTQDEIRQNPYVHHLSISENYFQLLSIPLKTGRAFNSFDNRRSQPVAIVSERLAKRLWSGVNPLGRRLRFDPLAKQPGRFCKVVGVVGSVQHGQLGGERSFDMYVSYRQEPDANQFVLAKTNLNMREFQSRAEKVAWSIDPEQSVFDFATYDRRILDSIWQLRLSRLLFILFGFVALILAAIGVYSLMSHLVAKRTREIGVRLALGATPAEVQALVIKRGAELSAVGLPIGLLGTLLLTQWLRSRIAALSAIDWMSLSMSLLILLTILSLACVLPAWRAASIDPIEALRSE